MFHRQSPAILDHIGQTGGKVGAAFLFSCIIGGNTASIPRRLNNRAIAGTAAQVPGQCIIDRPAILLATIQPQLIQAHDKTGCAETTLRSMGLDHRLLHRMQAAVLGFKMLDRQKLFAIKGRDKLDTGVHRAIGHAPIAVWLTNNDGTGPAIPLRTAFFRT